MESSVTRNSRLLARLSILFLVAAAFAASAASLTFTGPTLPDGTPCAAGDPGCIIGSPLSFEVFSVTITQPSGMNPNWTLSIQTNYPDTIPTPGTAIPPAPWHDGLLYSIPDFLIHWNGNDYGIILADHVKGSALVGDGFAAGNLYQATNGLVLSGDVLTTPGFPSPRPTVPVWLGPEAVPDLLGSGSFTVVANGNGSTSSSYIVTESFSAPANFLSSGLFTIQASSYTCDNGLLVASGQFTTNEVPEPATFMLALPALFLIGLRLKRKTQA